MMTLIFALTQAVCGRREVAVCGQAVWELPAGVPTGPAAAAEVAGAPCPARLLPAEAADLDAAAERAGPGAAARRRRRRTSQPPLNVASVQKSR